MSLSKRKMDKLDDEKRKINKEYLSNKEYSLIKAEDYMVIKDNRLIQKATFDFTELEMKCINYAISKMQPNKTYTENDFIELSIVELCNLMGIKAEGNNYKHIRQAFGNIRDKSKIIKIDKENDIDVSFSFFLKVYGCEKGGWIKVSFFDELLNYLQGLKNKFSGWELYYTLVLKNKYTIRMYELCKSYQNLGHFTLYLDKMIMKWCIPKSYRYIDIKRQIIEPSIKEINEKTDILVEIIDIIKQGKKVVALELKITDNSNKRCMQIDKKQKNQEKEEWTEEDENELKKLNDFWEHKNSSTPPWTDILEKKMFDRTEQLKNKKKRIEEEQKSFMNEINLIDTFYQEKNNNIKKHNNYNYHKKSIEEQIDEVFDNLDPEWLKKLEAGELDDKTP